MLLGFPGAAGFPFRRRCRCHWLAGPSPGAAGPHAPVSSPPCLSALSAPGDPAAAARWNARPRPPPQRLAATVIRSPGPTGRLAVTPRRAGLGGGGLIQGILSPSPFFPSPAALLVSLTLLCLFPAPPPKSWALSLSKVSSTSHSGVPQPPPTPNRYSGAVVSASCSTAVSVSPV